MPMQLGMIGLGRMGGNMSERLLRAGHEVLVTDRDAAAVSRYTQLGAVAAEDAVSLASALRVPRVIWMMIPAGDPVEDTIRLLVPHLAADDILIDGGNSNYRDTLRRAAALSHEGIHLVDCGTSGGVWGLEHGYCLMVGGDASAVARCEPLFRALAPPDGYRHVGPAGAGHYVKMVHNGIEYGLLQAYAEGYEILHASRDFDLDLGLIAELWNHGSVVRSWLNELAAHALADAEAVEQLRGYVSDSGEGRWTVQEAIDLDVPAPVITLALLMRLRSRQDDTFAGKVIAALRREFGGHSVRES